MTPRIYASDEVQYFSYLRSLWFDHDVSFENEYQHFYDSRHRARTRLPRDVSRAQTETGRRISFATIGVGDPVGAVLRRRRCRRARWRGLADRRSSRWLRPAVRAAVATARRSTARGDCCCRSVRREHRARRAAASLAALAVWFGTPLLFYMYVAPPMAHACPAFAVALFVLVWLHVRERWTLAGGLALGAAGALMVMVREQDVTFFAAPALDSGDAAC